MCQAMIRSECHCVHGKPRAPKGVGRTPGGNRGEEHQVGGNECISSMAGRNMATANQPGQGPSSKRTMVRDENGGKGQAEVGSHECLKGFQAFF
jgi:hypothetical protein